MVVPQFVHENMVFLKSGDTWHKSVSRTEQSGRFLNFFSEPNIGLLCALFGNIWRRTW